MRLLCFCFLLILYLGRSGKKYHDFDPLEDCPKLDDPEEEGDWCPYLAVEGYDSHPWVNGLYEKYEGRWSSLLSNSLYTHIKSRRFSHMTITRDSHGSVCIVNRRKYKKDKTLAEGNMY